MECKHRKTTRLQGFDYNMPGCYFITVCTKDKKKLLCEIVGTGLPDGPKISLTKQGKIAQDQLQTMAHFYDSMVLEKFVIMPNHIHMLIQITQDICGPSGRPVPTKTPPSGDGGVFLLQQMGTQVFAAAGA